MAQNKFNTTKRSTSIKRPTTVQLILLAVAVVAAIGLFIFLRGFVACWQITPLPGLLPPECQSQVTDPGTNVDGTPVAGDRTPVPTLSAPQGELPEPWDGASRVTVLLIGLDYSDWRAGEGAPRSDTMMLLTLDPLTMTAGIMSVPRDLWVNVPGFGYNKINTAYAYGEGNKLPGGGPALAMKTVENLLGIQIDYYAQVDFTTFERMIDLIGEICLDVPAEILVGRTYMEPLLLHPGYQCLDGKLALGYARERHTEGGDVDRAARQQQVIEAIMNEVFNPANFPTFVANAPALYAELSSGIHTDMLLEDAVRLAVLAKDLDRAEIRWGVIDYTMADIGTVNTDGHDVSIMRPYPDAIRQLTDYVFGGGAMMPMATGDATQLMQAEQARVSILNGSGVDGLAAKTQEYLAGQGMNVVGVGNASYRSNTLLILHNGTPYTVNYLKALMQINAASQITFDYDPAADSDLEVVLGADWGASNPMP